MDALNEHVRDVAVSAAREAQRAAVACAREERTLLWLVDAGLPCHLARHMTPKTGC
jgi:hypothetical protein